MVRDSVDMGVAGITIPTRYGGQGLTALEFSLAVEEACRAMKSWMAGDVLFATTCTGPSVLMISGNEEAQERYLPDIAQGRRTAAIALSEPDHGSAVTDIETTARRKGDTLVVNGTKRFITGAPEYDTYVTFVRLDGVPGGKGIGAVVAEKGTLGLKLGQGPDYMGSRGSPHEELHFTDCQLPMANLLTAEGSFPVLMQAFNMERLYIASLCLGLAEGAYDEAVAYAAQRHQFGRPIARRRRGPGRVLEGDAGARRERARHRVPARAVLPGRHRVVDRRGHHPGPQEHHRVAAARQASRPARPLRRGSAVASRGHGIDEPPPTATTCPVTWRAAREDDSQTTASATSPGVVRRRSGVCRRTYSIWSSSKTASRPAAHRLAAPTPPSSGRTRPGHTTLDRTPLRPCSRAVVRARAMSPAFVVP
jgi:alkylation response protein AidB-like acyl-CoA dehydrogenase